MEMIKNTTVIGVAGVESKPFSGLSHAFLRWRIRHNERMLNNVTRDLRQAQIAPVRDPSREGSDKAIIAQLEQRIAALKSRL